MNLRNVHPGTVIKLEDGQVAVAAVGPGRGRRYVMQESGVVLVTRLWPFLKTFYGQNRAF